MSNQVSVPASFFVKTARRDYGDPAEAFLREFLQNSRDAGAVKIDLTVAEVDGKAVFICEDNGKGMDEQTVVNKLMALGESGKDGDIGSTGGFGVAKILIYFAQHSYMIKTRDLVIAGAGSGYHIDRTEAYIQGVHATVVLNPEVFTYSAAELEDRFRREIQRSDLSLEITLNGLTVVADKRRGRLASDLGSGVKVYKRRVDFGTTSRYSVRVKGLHMFSVYCAEMKHEVIVELSGYSTEILTTNRDGFRGQWRETVAGYVSALALNSNTGDKSAITLYRGMGSRISATEQAVVLMFANLAVEAAKASPEAVEGFVTQASQSLESQGEVGRKALKEAIYRAIDLGTEVTGSDLAGIQLRHNYYVETTGNFRKIPKKWEPANFTNKQKSLLELWAAVMALSLEDAGLAGKQFDVGFIIDDGTSGEPAALAKYVETASNMVFLLNPQAYGSEQTLPSLRSTDMIHYLISCATHEATHAAGHSYHNESFISAEAEIRRKAMKRLKKYLNLRK